MSIQTEGPNPLRPYYVPPSTDSTSLVLGELSSPLSSSGRNVSSRVSTTRSFGSSTRNILADLDYSEYLSDTSPSPGEVGRSLVEHALWKYTSIFLAQPFDVAKIILQAQRGIAAQGSAKDHSTGDTRRPPQNHQRNTYETPSDDSDPDSPSYFTSAAPLQYTPSRPSRVRRHYDGPGSLSRSRMRNSRSPSPELKKSPHTLNLKSSSSLIGVISSLWTAEGAWGIWKGTNSTYLLSILSSTIASFTRSFISALLGLPDPGLSIQLSPPLTYAGGLDILSSPSPLTSLAVVISAAGIAGIVLAPLDIIRTKLMLTPSTHPPRSVLPTLRSLSSWTLPFSIAPVTILYATIPTLISSSTPLFLRSKLGVDPVLNPNLYTVAIFIAQTLELGVKLPLETILRRGQVEVAFAESPSQKLQTVVEVGPYRGLFGTIHSIVYEEGEREVRTEPVRPASDGKGPRVMKAAQKRQRKKGQGLEGLWRGWRVGMWGIVGVWGAATLGGVGGRGGEF